MSLLYWPQAVIHNLLHRHYSADKDGLGTFSFCSRVLPGGRVRILFRPDLDGAGWHRVPLARDGDGVALFERMLWAASAHDAMAMLRRELP